MAAQEFTVLYTHQKTKKAKVWQDGILKTSGGQQAVLYSDKGQSLDCVYVKTGMVSPGDELESDRYLITVEAVGNTNSSTKCSTENKDVQNGLRLSQKPIGLRPPAGLKRKFMGFQGPREIAKKPSPDVEETATLSSLQLAHGCSSQSPQLYATSPLFASPYGKQTDKEKQVYCSSKEKIVTMTNPDSREYTFTSKSLASPNQPVTKVSGDRVIEVKQAKPRSTAQILALLNALPGQKEPVSDHVPAGVSTVCSNEIQKTTSMRNDLEDAKPCTIPSELSPIRAKPVKSRWEVYLDNPVDPSSTQIDHDDLVLSPSTVKMLMDDKARPEEDRELHIKIDMEENKQLPYSHISKPGLTNNQSATPQSLAVGTDDFIPDDEDNDGAFSEITFNLIDSFDFTELDDADSTESPPETVSHSAKASTHLTEKQEFLQKESQEKHGDDELTENTPLHKNWETTTVSELSHNKAECESTIQTLQNSQSKMDKTGDNDSKAEVMTQTNVLQTVGKGGILCHKKFQEGQIPSRHLMFQLDDIAKQKALAKNPQEPFESPSVLPHANMHHSVQGSNEDGNSSELSPSGNCISLLRSLTTPSNALESLNVFCSMTPTTTENIDKDSQTYLERSEKQGQDYRFLIRPK